MYDGVHVLLKDRSEMGNYFVPDLKHSRKNDSEHVYSDYSPAHVHHNWRFSDNFGESSNKWFYWLEYDDHKTNLKETNNEK